MADVMAWAWIREELNVLQAFQKDNSVQCGKNPETPIIMPAATPNIQDVYAYVTRILPPTALLQLAALILNGLTQQNRSVVDESDTWAEQDQLDLSAFSLQHFSAVSFGDEELVCIGQLSARDWQGVRACVKVALAELDSPEA